MVEHVSLSIEETNKLRISLGLKPIEPPADKNSDHSVKIEDGDESGKSSSYDKSAFIDPKIAKLRWNLQRVQSKAQENTILSDGKDDDSQDWIENVKVKGRSARPTLAKSYYDEDNENEDSEDQSRLRVSHQLSEIVPGKNVILTLKESEVDTDDVEDTLINEGLAHDKEQAKNMGLKRMNQERKRQKISIGRGHLEDDDNDDNNLDADSKIYLVGSEIIGNQPDKQAQKESRDGQKIYVGSESDDREDVAQEASDFAAVKIKKRKKLNAKTASNKRSRPTSQAPRVALVDEDFVDSAEEEMQDFLKVRNPKQRDREESNKTPEEIAREVEQEKKERASHVRNMNYAQGITIDENSAFLSSLKADLVTGKGDSSETTFQKVDLKAAVADPEYSQSAKSKHVYSSDDDEDHHDNDEYNGGKASASGEDTGVNFQDGLAATLGFLRDRNVLPAQRAGGASVDSNDSKVTELLALRQQQVARKVRDQFAQELAQGNVRYNKEELEQLQQLQEQEISKRNQNLQRQRLATYNPDVNLTYKDEAGHVLTTKEAYKKLSQAFHGTRSNRKKHIKAQQKVRDRNKNQDTYIA
ncbi:LAME_0E13124g1_1 [Lachancea meyersii CBS 8951]|uniref:LAME_0E13124g1_1 n=1 Tax=Lachancea meyersii CBS 8951 TaxID=1266667 RepID=A0A1G4JM98_9SACH|nr:LAME_0E13124g1_1 [Lachancea meyersii CBS 8951]